MEDLNHWRDEITGVVARALCGEKPPTAEVGILLRALIARIDKAFAALKVLTVADPVEAVIAQHAGASPERRREIMDKLRTAFSPNGVKK